MPPACASRRSGTTPRWRGILASEPTATSPKWRIPTIPRLSRRWSGRPCASRTRCRRPVPRPRVGTAHRRGAARVRVQLGRHRGPVGGGCHLRPSDRDDGDASALDGPSRRRPARPNRTDEIGTRRRNRRHPSGTPRQTVGLGVLTKAAKGGWSPASGGTDRETPVGLPGAARVGGSTNARLFRSRQSSRSLALASR